MYGQIPSNQQPSLLCVSHTYLMYHLCGSRIFHDFMIRNMGEKDGIRRFALTNPLPGDI